MAKGMLAAGLFTSSWSSIGGGGVAGADPLAGYLVYQPGTGVTAYIDSIFICNTTDSDCADVVIAIAPHYDTGKAIFYLYSNLEIPARDTFLISTPIILPPKNALGVNTAKSGLHVSIFGKVAD